MKLNLETKTAPVNLSIAVFENKIQRNNILINCALQRQKNRWSLIDKSNEISDLLQGNIFPTIFLAERKNENGVPQLVLIDGLQRITNAIDYIHDKYKISKKVDVGVIPYVDNGEICEFDICGKKFSQLPMELQNILKEYSFQIVKFLNCTDEEVRYHLSRLNRGLRMNNSEKTVCNIGENFAIKMRDILDNAFFCMDHENYTNKERNTSALAKTVLECIMIINHFDDWKKNSLDMGEYLSVNSSDQEFDSFYEMSEDLDDLITDNVRSLFNTKNSFLYFKLLAEYHKNGLTTNQFVDFMKEFKNGMSKNKYNDISWDELMEISRSNRDKSVIESRLKWLYSASKSYFNVEFNSEENIKIVEDAPLNEDLNKIESEVSIKEKGELNNEVDSEVDCEMDDETINEVAHVNSNKETLNNTYDNITRKPILANDYYSMIAESDLVKSLGFFKEDICELANEAMSLYKNVSIDKMEHLNLTEINSSDYLEIKENLNVVDMVTCKVDNNSEFFQIENIAVLINIAKEAFDLNVSDKEFENFVVKYIDNFTDAKLTGSYIDRFTTLSNEFKTFVNSNKDVLMIAS